MFRKLLVAMALAAVASAAGAAEVSDVFNQLVYRDIAHGQGQANQALVEKYVLPVMQARVDSGQITGWTAYTVAYPSGSDTGYDVITVTQVDDYAKLEPGGGFRAAFDEVHGSDRWDAFIDAIVPTSHVVRTEVWEQKLVVGENAGDPDGWLKLNFVKVRPGQLPAYESLLSDFAAPFWAERVKTAGRNWSSHILREPGSAGSPHDYVGVVGYRSFADMRPMDDALEVFARAHPSEDIGEIGPRFGETSDPAGQETWQLLLSTQ
jgi:hypothetical protein